MILHIDMDAFFASIEQRDNPLLRNRPVIVSGNSKRSVVSTASYEARKFGIRSAMPVFMAKEKCRNLVIVPGNMKKYAANSKKIMAIISQFSPRVEQVSIDEAYVDTRGCERLFGSPQTIAGHIKNNIYNELGLKCSIGIAPLKFISKIASDMEKPDGLTLIGHSQVKDFIEHLPIGKVPGIGNRAMKQMESLQIRTLGDVKKFPLKILSQKFGKMGQRLLELSNGVDNTGVKSGGKRKSISSETTLAKDIFDFESVKQVILGRSQGVGRDLRKKKLVCRNVSIKLKFSDFSQITRSRKLSTPICSSTSIFNEAMALYQKVLIKKKIRLVGVGVSALEDKNTPVQMEWVENAVMAKEQWESVDTAVDLISDKFGRHIVGKASLTLKTGTATKGEEPGSKHRGKTRD